MDSARPRVSVTAAAALAVAANACRSTEAPATASAEGERPGAKLVDLSEVDPSIKIDLRYATAGNVFGRPLYPVARCLLRRSVAERLSRVQKRLRPKGLGLKIWDAYRPHSVQKEMWAMKPDPRFIADPKKGSKHNRGAAVDLTLVDRSGYELAMPTGFDEFTDRAARGYMRLSPDVLGNRQLLTDAMQAEGFVGLPSEWWHFDAPDALEYPLLDAPLQ